MKTENYAISDTSSDYHNFSEKKFLQIGEQLDAPFKKIESKDNQWKPAPIIGRDMHNMQ